MKSIIALTVCFLTLAIIATIVDIISTWKKKSRRRQIVKLMGVEVEQPLPKKKEKTHAVGERGEVGIIVFGYFLNLDRLSSLLVSADVNMTVERYIVISLAMLMAAFSLVFIFSHHILVAAMATALATIFPVIFLMHRRRKRDDALVDQLPEALDMIVRALRVGQSVDNALREVAKNSPAPLNLEVQTLHEEVALGIPFIQALRNFETRFSRLAEVKLMTTAFIIQRETGGNLTRVLANLSGLIRERDTLKRQIKSMTAEGRSSALILGLLPLFVGAFFWLIRPEYIGILFNHPVGRKIFLVAVLLEILGFSLMRLMSRIEP